MANSRQVINVLVSSRGEGEFEIYIYNTINFYQGENKIFFSQGLKVFYILYPDKNKNSEEELWEQHM